MRSPIQHSYAQSFAAEQKSGRQETLNCQTEGLPFPKVSMMPFDYVSTLMNCFRRDHVEILTKFKHTVCINKYSLLLGKNFRESKYQWGFNNYKTND